MTERASITRRALLGTGLASAAGLALTGCQPNTPTSNTEKEAAIRKRLLFTVDSDSPASRLLTIFDGLCTFVTPPAPKEVSEGKICRVGAMDIALLSTDRIVETFGRSVHPGHVSPHHPTLIVPRNAIDHQSDARPVAVDVNHAYFALDGFDVEIGPQDQRELEISCAALPDICPLDVHEWNNFNWVLDFHSEIHSGRLANGWRHSDQVRAIVKLRAGTVEGADLTDEDKGSSAGRRMWQLSNGTTRVLKETVRHSLAIESPQRLILTARDSRISKSVILRWRGEIEIGVVQLPAFFMSDGGVPRLDDLFANYFLLENLPGKPVVPAPSDKICNPEATNVCGCCPGVRFVEENFYGTKAGESD